MRIIFNNDNCKRPYAQLTAIEVPCIRCGTCCSKFQPRLSLEEARSIAIRLEIEWDRFLAEYTDRRWPGTESFLIRHVNGSCLFLQSSVDSQERLCSIHAFKPACCCEWQSGPDRSECRQGLEICWDLHIDPSGRICGDPDKIKSFEQFIRSLEIE